MKKTYIYSVIIFLVTGGLFAQQTPASKQTTAYSIEGATAHLGNGKVIENSLIMFNDGKIIHVGSAKTKIARLGKTINAKGKHVYPGFIAANSTLGLVEIDAVRATVDVDEVGTMLPHIRSMIAYNSESKVVESMRPNGVLLAEVTPRGGVISGSSSVMQLDAWNWEDAVVKVDNGIHMNWPSSLTRGRWWMGEDPALKPDSKYSENINSIEEFFLSAKRYLANNKNTVSLPYEAMAGVFDGSKKLFIHVNDQKEITDAIQATLKFGAKNLVIVGGAEAHKVSSLLKEHNIPVVVDRAHRVPNNIDDDYDLPYRTASLLVNNGVTVAIGMEGQMERMNTRNLPFYAGTYAAHGMDKEQAVQMITGNAAKILGIDEFTGTLEVGKAATLFISEGDALDMRTNIVNDAWIEGRKISLETHQTTLYKRYLKKLKDNQ